jgi:conjugal transfer pilus assembly protein TraV
LLAALVAPMVLGACAAVNPCKNKYGGLCASPREIYGATRNRDQINPTAATLKSQKKAAQLINSAPKPSEELPSIDSVNPHTLPSNVMEHTHVSADLGKVSAITPEQGGPISQIDGAHSVPYPLLKQPRVARVWVAPFVDQHDQLHFPGYIYSVVKNNTWTFGQGSDKATPPVPSAEQAQAANPPQQDAPGSTSASGLGMVSH